MRTYWFELLLVLAAGGAACADAPIDDGSIGRRNYSSGGVDGGSADASSGDAAADPGGSSSGDTSSSGSSGSSGQTSPNLCVGSDIALCLTFEGNTFDLSILPVSPATSTGITFVAGKSGQAGSFTATSALRYAASSKFELPAAAATVEAWIKRQNTGNQVTVFDDDGRLTLFLGPAGRVTCGASGGASVSGTTVVPVDQWTHVACVVDTGKMHVFVGGKQDASGSGSIASKPTGGAAVGGASPTGMPFVGLIDSLRVFRVARTAAELALAAAQ